MNRTRIVLIALAAFVIGGGIAAYAFSGVERRSFLAIHECGDGQCLAKNDLVGLLASVGLQRADGLLPKVVKETDLTIAFEYQPGWFVVFPKHDIKNIADFREGEEAYLVDSYAVMSDLIRAKGMTKWQIFTNGPKIQHMTYLHFHLIDYTLAREAI